MKRERMFKAAKMMFFGIVFVLVAGGVVMLLWNALIPDIFGGAPITWVQALGLLILARILTGRWGRGGSSGRRRWRERWERRVANMTPEEREKWRAEFGRCCCGDVGVAERRTEERDALEAKA